MSLLLAFDPATMFVLVLLVFGAPIVLIGSIVFFWRARNASQDGEVDPKAAEGGRRPQHTIVSNDDA